MVKTQSKLKMARPFSSLEVLVSVVPLLALLTYFFLSYAVYVNLLSVIYTDGFGCCVW